MRKIIIAAIASVIALAHAGESSAPRSVDLNLAGRFDSLATENPAHYLKIQQILSGIQGQPVEAVPKWLNVQFDADQVSYTLTLMTSLPPKRYLKFVLDQTQYVVMIALPKDGPAIIPVSERNDR